MELNEIIIELSGISSYMEEKEMFSGLGQINDLIVKLKQINGGFSDGVKLERLVKKWKAESDIIKGMVDDVKNGKKPRTVYNHFLIQLLKCIGDAEVELKNCR